MGYTIHKLTNCTEFNSEQPTIIITSDMPEWKTAYQNWLNGKPPTNSPEWKKGIFAHTKEIAS